METIIYDIPMERFIKDYFKRHLMDALSRNTYPYPDPYSNSSTVVEWIVRLRQLHFADFFFTHNIYQTNHKTIHFSVVITDSRQIHRFEVRFDVERVRRLAKLNKIRNKICEL